MVKQAAPRTRRPKAMTRASILEQAYQMYLRREITHGDERLSVVLDALGYTTGAGYQIWPNQAAFRQELQVYIAEKIEWASPANVDDQILELWAQDLDNERHILGIGDICADTFFGDEAFYIILRFLAMGDDRPPEVTEALQRSYRAIQDELVPRLAKAMELRNLPLREGLSIDDLALAVNALAEGYALRLRVEPDLPRIDFLGAPHHPFAIAFLGLVKQYVVVDETGASASSAGMAVDAGSN